MCIQFQAYAVDFQFDAAILHAIAYICISIHTDARTCISLLIRVCVVTANEHCVLKIRLLTALPIHFHCHSLLTMFVFFLSTVVANAQLYVKPTTVYKNSFPLSCPSTGKPSECMLQWNSILCNSHRSTAHARFLMQINSLGSF